ncbi:MAG: sigma 54-interacting transcriptional regulator [Pirellulales bacterium]|nr:sigma 54-interacting transcriptional regulator [Pirellulales bacterium]
MPHRNVLLQVWREACQHIEIQESVAGIARLLDEHLPLEKLLVYRVEQDHHFAACVAATPQSARPTVGDGELSPADFKRLLGWIRQGRPATPDGRNRLVELLQLARSIEPSRDLRAAPLAHGDDSFGAMAIVAPAGVRFTLRDEEIIAALQEPLSAALANDRRLHELATYREAAEADRRSLLRRLGRTDITDDIVGAEGGLAQVMSRVELVSQSDAPVLLLGETGTGKEVVARAVHQRSGRRDGPFIRVNCGAIPRELVDSHLFGYEKGAFTGATEQRRGWFERADGGTLFLDEIGELPPDAQVRFLRVLQDSFIERVGGGEPVRVDVRVVAATHRDLAGMAQSGGFREDLWYRIAVFPILLPPLRDRLGDIAELAEHFAGRAATRFGLSPVMPSAADVALLRNYDWPGNIRELGAVIDRAAILGDGRSLEIEAALGFSTTAKAPSRETSRPNDGIEVITLDAATRQHIEHALTTTQGRIEGGAGAAKLLDVNPHTLRARMRKLGIDWTTFRGPR